MTSNNSAKHHYYNDKIKKGLLPRLTFTLAQFFLVLLFFPITAQADFFKVDPEVGEWNEGTCSAPSRRSDPVAWCRASGGSWANFTCTGGDPAALSALSAVEQIKQFVLHRDRLCALPSVSFSGWGQPSHSSGCWADVTRSRYGVENWSTANMTTSGVAGEACDIAVSGQHSALRTRDVTCPAGSNPRDQGAGVFCYKFCPEGKILVDNMCSDPPSKKLGCDKDNLTKNPCNVSTGNKFRAEADITSGALGFTRYYNSLYLAKSGNGKGWRNGYQKELIFLSPFSLVLVSTSARGESWRKVDGIWYGDGDSKFTLTQDFSDYEITNSDGSLESYDDNGRLISETDTNGFQRLFSYNHQNQMTGVASHYGHQLSFDYVDDKLDTVTDRAGAVYRYQYDSMGNVVAVIFPDITPGTEVDNPRKLYHYEDLTRPSHLTGITDENGQRYATFSYDDTGLVLSSELAITSNTVGQEKIQLSYQGMSTTVTDAIGTPESWAFDDVLGVNKIIGKANSGDGKGITQTWDDNGNRLSHTDEEGRVTTYTYNETNQRLSMTEASGTPQARTTTYEYVSADIDLVTKTISPSIYASNTKEVVNSYDANQNITAVTINGFSASGTPVTRSTTFAHDVYGKVTQINGPRTDVNDITLLEYYDCATGAECGQLKKVTNAAGHISSYDSYDAAARLLQSTDANGIITTYTYHPRGWLLSMTQTPVSGAARTTTYDYDNAGQLTKTTLPDGAQQNYVYDAAHDLREISDNVGNKVTYQYDAKGNRTEELVFDPDGTLVRSTLTTYDIRNFIKSINNGGSVTQLINDAVGNLSTQTDPNANPDTTHSFDALDRLNTTVDALSNNSGYQYNVADQLTQVTAPNGVVTQYEYDDLGNQTKEISADRGTTIYTHDDAGNVISMTDARNITVSYQYDVLNRVTAIGYPQASENITYQFDQGINCGLAIGRLCQVNDAAGIQTYTYDVWGNVLTKAWSINGITHTLRYQYDAANRVTQLRYPSGLVVNYARDAIGRVTNVQSPMGLGAEVIADQFSYRADGLITGYRSGNSQIEQRTYDQQGRLTSQTLDGQQVASYSYDANGNVLQKNHADEQRAFNYDVLDRLQNDNWVSGLVAANDWQYSYDENGNRLTQQQNVSPIEALAYTSNSNQLSTIAGNPVITDAAGNITNLPRVTVI